MEVFFSGNRKEAIRLVDKGFFQIGKWLPPITIRIIRLLLKKLALSCAKVISGIWTHLIEKGFEPKSLGLEIYHHIICPSVLKIFGQGKSQPYGTPLQPTWDNFNFNIPQRPFTVPLVVEETTLHINSGILAIHNTKGYSKGNNGMLKDLFNLYVKKSDRTNGSIDGRVS
uniref:DUF7754 domain-containing protein n=1 Tax=Parascaris equorum TaxID=6256 RepID=A0A914SJ20_PAREQ